MNSQANDLVQQLLEESRNKDELINILKTQIAVLEELVAKKDEVIKNYDEHVEKMTAFLNKSLEQTDKALGMMNGLLL